MLSIILTLVGFILLTGLAIVIVEVHNAPLMADDEMTILDPAKRKGDSTNV